MKKLCSFYVYSFEELIELLKGEKSEIIEDVENGPKKVKSSSINHNNTTSQIRF